MLIVMGRTQTFTFLFTQHLTALSMIAKDNSTTFCKRSFLAWHSPADAAARAFSASSPENGFLGAPARVPWRWQSRMDMTTKMPRLYASASACDTAKVAKGPQVQLLLSTVLSTREVRCGSSLLQWILWFDDWEIIRFVRVKLAFVLFLWNDYETLWLTHEFLLWGRHP